MIQINLLRVSTDSKYIEFSVECPADYNFNLLYISRYNVSLAVYDTTKDCSSLLSGTTQKEIMRIATSAFGTDVTMYKVTFGIAPIDPAGADVAPEIGICSNVNFVYENLLNSVLKLTSCCIDDTTYDTLMRNHMILYAHQEAMRLERYTEAEYFYGIIWNLFSNCGGSTRAGSLVTNPCNCT
ncbi:MAG: hypothetical protein ACOYMD_03145 [Paludibacter sp.]